ncbi:MAG: bifunctional tetrahydrofolate synthase/dihydrofolate synthase [Rhodocyclaceae bacterium]
MPETLNDWLAYVERVHTRPVDLGLERVVRVKQAMGMTQSVPLIVVGGTNGKGSTCAILERILACAGYRVGVYSSPHLLRYNERVRVNGQEATDGALLAAFAAVEAARCATPLTYFEFGTLAAWHVFSRHPLDAVILEVGLGGRLDAVNLFDADCAVVTNVDLDHMDYLGPTREHIGFEKAGIFRPGRPAVIGDVDPPASLMAHAKAIGARCHRLGSEFGYLAEPSQWLYWSSGGGQTTRRGGLAYPNLRGANQLTNASTAIAALETLAQQLPVAMADIRRGLAEVHLPGRFQVLPGRPAIVLDVAHNPHAAKVLASNLGQMGFFGQTWAVFGMLRDKDIAGVVAALRGQIDRWVVCGLEGPRAAVAQEICAILAESGVAADAIETFATPEAALLAAREGCGENDRIVAFGSFLTVAGALRACGGVPRSQSHGHRR